MFLGVFDFTFVVWILIGAVSVLIVLGAIEWFKDAGIVMTWWKWLIATIWYIIVLMGLAAPFTLMGEGESAAGWKLLIFSVPVLVILAFIVLRILRIGKTKA
ncbi:MAG TPA: hypothetical protein G4N95_07125 [Anaerolineae bacterium]|nr:hypothetical protein [Anaerolineae bacterium]